MSKIPPKRVPSDDCILVVEGVEYTPHKGEWIDIVPFMTVRQEIAIIELLQSGKQNDANKANRSTQILCEEAANRVVDWNWTDLEGNPLPKPYRNPGVLHQLSNDELGYILKIMRGSESPAERKNALAPSAEK